MNFDSRTPAVKSLVLHISSWILWMYTKLTKQVMLLWVWEKLWKYLQKRRLAYSSSFCIYQGEDERKIGGGLFEWKHRIRNEISFWMKRREPPLSLKGIGLVMVLVVKVIKETFTCGLTWNLRWYPETQANCYEEFSTVLKLIPNSLA